MREENQVYLFFLPNRILSYLKIAILKNKILFFAQKSLLLCVCKRKKMTPERICWFAARTRKGQELAVRDRLCELGVEHFIPTRRVMRERRGKRKEVEAPLIPNLVFLRTVKSHACTLANAGLPIFYIIDRNTHTLLEVPQKQMEDFMLIMDLSPESLCLTEIPLRLGGKVSVIKGELAGVEGELLSLPTRTYVVVQVGNGLLSAKVRIPKSYLVALP